MGGEEQGGTSSYPASEHAWKPFMTKWLDSRRKEQWLPFHVKKCDVNLDYTSIRGQSNSQGRGRQVEFKCDQVGSEFGYHLPALWLATGREW